MKVTGLCRVKQWDREGEAHGRSQPAALVRASISGKSCFDREDGGSIPTPSLPRKTCNKYTMCDKLFKLQTPGIQIFMTMIYSEEDVFYSHGN